MASIAPDATGFAELGRVLWQHRQLLDDLQYRLEIQNLLLLAGRDRWVNRVTDEVQATLDDIAATEARRALLVAGLAPTLGLPPDASLRELAAAAPEPWGMILADHRASFLQIVDRIAELSQSARQVLHEGLERTRVMLKGFTASTATQQYDAAGRLVSDPGAAWLLDHEA